MTTHGNTFYHFWQESGGDNSLCTSLLSVFQKCTPKPSSGEFWELNSRWTRYLIQPKPTVLKTLTYAATARLSAFSDLASELTPQYGHAVASFLKDESKLVLGRCLPFVNNSSGTLAVKVCRSTAEIIVAIESEGPAFCGSFLRAISPKSVKSEMHRSDSWPSIVSGKSFRDLLLRTDQWLSKSHDR